MAIMYCLDSLDERFEAAPEKLEKRFREHIGSMERRYGSVNIPR